MEGVGKRRRERERGESFSPVYVLEVDVDLLGRTQQLWKERGGEVNAARINTI